MVQVQPELLVAPSKSELPSLLSTKIATMAAKAMKERNKFTIALSGGSLPKFLSSLSETYKQKPDELGDPKFENWYVYLADERCVPLDDDDSNLKSITDHFLNDVPIPKNQIYGIDQSLVEELLTVGKDDHDKSNKIMNDIALRYEEDMKKVVWVDGHMLDLAVLGFGPDGHTCSLFPGHKLLDDKSNRWVLPITDSPKPPPNRITLSLSFLNEKTRNVIVCGAGKSKFPIIDDVFEKDSLAGYYDTTKSTATTTNHSYRPKLVSPPPYPCSMVFPQDSLIWIVDGDAMVGDNGDNK